MTDVRRYRLPTNVSEVVCFVDRFREYSRFICSFTSKKKPSTYFMEKCDIDENEYEEISSKFKRLNECSWKTLEGNKFVVPVKGFRDDFKLYDIPNDTNLGSLLNLQENFVKSGKQRNRYLKYRGQVSCDFSDSPEKGRIKNNLKPHEDYLLTVRVYLPVQYHAFNPKRRTKQLNVSQEFIIHGKEKLSDLKDRIVCEEDYHSAEGDVSLNPFLPTKIINCNVFRSSMFFINDMFFIDGRYSGNIDYSEVIKEWAKKKGLPYTITKKMEEINFNNLSFRLGYPYLFMHQGSCEHLIIFTDARLVHPEDVLTKAAYPIMKSYSNSRGHRCGLCSKRIPKFIVINMKKLPSVTVYMCGLCLYQYCYTKDGKKIGEFSVFKYVDRAALL